MFVCLEEMSSAKRDVTARRVGAQRVLSRHVSGKHGSVPVAMGDPVVVGPAVGHPHLATIVWLPCFTWGAEEMTRARLPRLRAALPPRALDCVRIVILCAPMRPISCYSGKRHYAWHDYFSDHGGVDGRPNVEERIDVSQLAWARGQVHVEQRTLSTGCC